MTSFLDYKGLQSFWNKVKEIITDVQNDVSNLTSRVSANELNKADKEDTYTKQEIDELLSQSGTGDLATKDDVEEVAKVTAHAVNDIVSSIGTDETLRVSFDDTTHLVESNSLVNAIKTLDKEISSAKKDVSIFAVDKRMFIRAPKGLLSENDTPIFARYTKSSIRGVGDVENGDEINYWVGDRKAHVKVNGWIVPRKTYDGDALSPQDSSRFADEAVLVRCEFDGDGCESWNDNYDFFRLYCGGEDFIDWLHHAKNEYFICPLKIANKKLGVRIDRDGKTIVDYLPFSYQENMEGNYFFAKWR